MKKLFIVMLALCLFVVPAMAQTQDEPMEMNWEDLEESFVKTGYSGAFWDFPSLGISMMIPGGLDQTELSQEAVDRGFVDIFATEDESVAIMISYRDLGCETLADVEELVLENLEGAYIIGYYKLNGLGALMFVNPENDDLTVAIGTTEPGYYIQVSIKPISNEEINSLSGFIFGSIMPYTEE